MITLDDYFMGRDKLHADELTEDIVENAKVLIAVINDLLEYEFRGERKVSSGWRPLGVNEKAGGAKRSAHLTGEAIDLMDKDGELADLLMARRDLLDTYDLYMENPHFTKGWVHLQTRPTRSGVRVFNP